MDARRGRVNAGRFIIGNAKSVAPVHRRGADRCIDIKIERPGPVVAKLACVAALGVVVEREIDWKPSPLFPVEKLDLGELVPVSAVDRAVGRKELALPAERAARIRLHGKRVATWNGVGRRRSLAEIEPHVFQVLVRPETAAMLRIAALVAKARRRRFVRIRTGTRA